jgi:hypothetical protein
MEDEGISLKIKPTAGGDAVFAVSSARSALVRELKEEVAKACDTPADQIRLIYKGAHTASTCRDVWPPITPGTPNDGGATLQAKF